jgi:hypothetical protein
MQHAQGWAIVMHHCNTFSFIMKWDFCHLPFGTKMFMLETMTGNTKFSSFSSKWELIGELKILSSL